MIEQSKQYVCLSVFVNARNYKFNSIVNSYSDSIKFDIKKELRKEEGKKIALFNKNYFQTK